MKWIYVPVMFALSFLYTKISFNNFQVRDGGVVTLGSRRPASVETPKKVSSLRRIPATAFYKNLSEEDLLVFSKVTPYRGTVIGDVHVESFGYVIDDKKKATFTINDFSEVTEGALFHDVLGHLLSAKNLDKRITWIDYFEAYKKGLRAESYSFSFYTEKGLEEAAIEADKTVEENISHDFPFEFTKIRKTHHHINAVARNSLQNEMTKIFPKIQFFDLIETNGAEGNFQVLARVRPQDKIQWLMLEEISHCDYDMNFNKANEVAFTKRFEMLKNNVYSGRMDKSLYAFKMDKKIFTVKLAEQFASQMKLNQIPFDDYHDIVMDEAYALGKIHRKSLGENVDDYIKSWATIASVNIDEKIITMKYKLKDTLR